MFGDAEPAGVNVMTVQGKSTLTGSFTGDSTASLLNSAEADARIVVRQADQTLSAPMARLREDTVCFCADHFHGRACKCTIRSRRSVNSVSYHPAYL